VFHSYLGNICKFFLRRLYAKGELSMEDCTIALIEAGETLHTNEGDYDDASMLRMGLNDLIIRLRRGHKFTRFTLESFTAAAVSKEKKLKALIVPAKLTRCQKEILIQYDEGKGRFWEDRVWAEYEHIQWKFAPGWRVKYNKIPRLDHVEH
jgi:hypothetical protein